MVQHTDVPTSVRTDYAGDFKAGHKDSPYKTFDEEVVRVDKFLNVDKISTIAFKSTKVVQTDKTLKVTGDLTFLGVTKPVTLLGGVVGSVEKHPYLGKAAVGFSPTGTAARNTCQLPSGFKSDQSMRISGRLWRINHCAMLA